MSRTASRASRSAPTTISRNRSPRRSSSCASARCCAAWPRPPAFVKLATRLFVTTSLLVAAAVGSLTIAADRMLGRHLEDEIARGLEREARLVADLLPADSLRWPEFARELGTRVGQRVTLIDAKGTVRGDTEFDRASLDRLENHLLRPEVQQALSTSVGRAERLSASTNERRMYIAVRGGPGGPAVVRVSTTLAAVDAQVDAVQRTVALTGLGAILAAGARARRAHAARHRPRAPQRGRVARDPRRHRAATPGGRAPRLRRQRVPRAQDAAHIHRRVRRNARARGDAGDPDRALYPAHPE